MKTKKVEKEVVLVRLAPVKIPWKTLGWICAGIIGYFVFFIGLAIIT